MRKLPIWVAAAAVLVLIIGWAFVTHPPVASSRSTTSSRSASATTITLSRVGGVSAILGVETQGSSPGNWLADDPAIGGSSLNIDYPPYYSILANYTLGLINEDRGSAGLAPVVLSTVPSGQQHADSMDYYGYFSHWDNQGYKPYTRYTLLGGTGSVSENLALNSCETPATNSTGAVPAPCTIQTVENAINASEWGMMNNDATCCGNGHRENIIEPIHNRVSLGVAYNSTTVFLVEDFEDSYVTSESLQVSSGLVTFNGSLPREPYAWMNRTAGAEITVFYDPTPATISPSKLELSASCSQYSELDEPTACQYQGGYNPGTEVSTVLFPCSAGECSNAANFTYAQTWQYVNGNFTIVFSINGLVVAHGPGVYTFYLWPAERAPEPITSLSVFVTGG